MFWNYVDQKNVPKFETFGKKIVAGFKIANQMLSNEFSRHKLSIL